MSPPEHRPQQRRLARAVRADERDPLPCGHEQIDRPQPEVGGCIHDNPGEAGDDVATAGSRRDVETQLPRHAWLVDDVETFDRLLGAGGLAGELLGLVDAEVTDVLVVLARPAHLGLALARPLPLALSSPGQVRPLRVELLETLPRMAFGSRPLVEVGLPATVEPCCLVIELVDLQHAGDGPGEERAVVADEHDAGSEIVDPTFEHRQSVEVEVIRRLVEQVDIEARGGATTRVRRGGLATGQRRDRLVEEVGVQAQLRPNLARRDGKSATPSDSHRVSATSYRVSAPSSPAASDALAASSSADAPVAPVRRWR